MTIEMAEHGCTCFKSPPCSFCVGMNEPELAVYERGGQAALIRFIRLEPAEREAESIINGTTEIPCAELTPEQRLIFGIIEI